MKSKSCRVALSALLHDLGKMTQRAKIYQKHSRLGGNKAVYCPKTSMEKGGYYTHVHAACTAISFDELEAFFPDIVMGDVSPFASRSTSDKEITDCLANGAAGHHMPETFLQWCIAIADRTASGFEREKFEAYNKSKDPNNFITTELMTIFEQVGNKKAKDSDYCFSYPLKPLTPNSIFPHKKLNRKEGQAVNEYKQLWDNLCREIQNIPASHRQSWPLWLDHFDSLWLTMSHAIPSATAFGTKPDVSLYDHSKTTAALAVALWRYHEETDDKKAASVKNNLETHKFLLIQGDFFGIQDFIFNSEMHKDAKVAKLLRGRSFFVSLLCECAALKVLDTLDLPSTSQIINAAGKFLIVAPNTENTIAAIKELQTDFNQWFREQTLGLAGIGLASCAASPNDFKEKSFGSLKDRLAVSLDKAKLQRMNLCGENVAPAILDVDYRMGECPYDKRLPVTAGMKFNKLNHDQITIGGLLAKEGYSRLLIFNNGDDIGERTGKLKTEIFGYTILLTRNEAETGKFGALAEKGVLQRAFDISLPETDGDAPLWQGYSRRNINAYVPTHKINPEDNPLYAGLAQSEKDAGKYGDLKTFEHLARDDQSLTRDEKVKGVIGLGVLKGDIDNLGDMFQNNTDSFAKLASLSRQINNFFALYLPWLCKTDEKFQDIYTVFAGGDDFYMIGPWYKMQEFAGRMRDDFQRYVAGNSHIHFSAGYLMVKPGLPLRTLSEQADTALEKAKKKKDKQGECREKNALTVFDQTVSWNDWPAMTETGRALKDVATKYNFSTAYLYNLLELTKMAEEVDENPENARWRSLFYYRTRRMVKDDPGKLTEIASIVGDGIEKLKGAYRIPLFNYIYKNRDQK